MLRQLTILGPGLLGGSIGLAARHVKAAERIVIWARRPEAVDQAWKLGAADEATENLEKAAEHYRASMAGLATPIGAMQALAEKMKPSLPDGCVVTDVGSVKYPVVSALTHALSGKARFVGSHPMAGSEQSGIDAARRDLFQDAVCIVTPRKDTDPVALRLVFDFWKTLGCSVATLTPEMHDAIVAQVSHLPHLVAAALVNVVCAGGSKPLNFVGPGFKDVTRVASGTTEMWTEICLENRDEIGRAALKNADAVELRAMLKQAKHFRDELRFRT